MRIASLLAIALLSTAAGQVALAKLPPPSDEAKAKAAEAAAKAAWGNKVADFQLCKSQDRAAAAHQAAMKQAGKEAKPPLATAACADPGPYVSPAAAAAAAAAPAASATPVSSAAPAASAAPAPAPVAAAAPKKP